MGCVNGLLLRLLLLLLLYGEVHHVASIEDREEQEGEATHTTTNTTSSSIVVLLQQTKLENHTMWPASKTRRNERGPERCSVPLLSLLKIVIPVLVRKQHIREPYHVASIKNTEEREWPRALQRAARAARRQRPVRHRRRLIVLGGVWSG